jgi:hypothetical protein
MGKFLALFALSSVLISSCGSLSQDFLNNTGSDNEKSSAKANSISDLPASSENRATKEPSDVVDPKQDALHAQASAAAKTNPDALYCPTGSWYSPSEKLCVTQSQAVGPFTRTMIALCKKYGGGEASCETSRWERGFAARLRLRETCPRGAVFDDTRQACVEGNEVYGPFRLREVDACRTRGGGATCETMRWNVSFMPQQIRGGAANRKLLSFYGMRGNYDDVFEEVLSFYPAGRRNGCVAFMSTALRRAGTTVPLSGYINGESVSLVTKPFSQYLQERLGWIKINSANNLQPGDVVLTEDDARYPGYPAHTYMFYGWSNQRAGIGWVIDNQDFIHERNIFGYGTYNFTPFAYALRSPE